MGGDTRIVFIMFLTGKSRPRSQFLKLKSSGRVRVAVNPDRTHADTGENMQTPRTEPMIVSL